MDVKEFAVFDAICSRHNIVGDVLEIGAMPNNTALLNMPSLGNAKSKLGLDLAEPAEYKDFRILHGNANHMEAFADATFDCVLCASVFEHDKYFWMTVSEIKRVTKPGGLVILSTPGYGDSFMLRCLERIGVAHTDGNQSRTRQLFPAASRNDFVGVLSRFILRLYGFAASTPTLAIHNWPGDYYRFSVQTFKEVLLDGLENTEIYPILFPLRIIGAGVKPFSAVHESMVDGHC